MDNIMESYRGLLAIGDPHLESRVPGFRKDDFPRVALDKLSWCLSYAHSNKLLPIILGDVFHLPRDNANWMLGELMVMFHRGVNGIYGNHDVRQNELTDDDSLDILVKGGKYQLLSEENPWQGKINGRSVVIGGTSWGKMLPSNFRHNSSRDGSPLVVWIVHHDVKVPGYEEQGRFEPREISGVDIVINGHIHRRLGEVQIGSTLWITPGNITRRTRSDASRRHVPSVLQIDIEASGYKFQFIEIPHQSFDEVFHKAALPDSAILDDERVVDSAFVAGLAELLARKTDTAAGLMDFLNINLEQFEEGVAKEIKELAKEVTRNVS